MGDPAGEGIAAAMGFLFVVVCTAFLLGFGFLIYYGLVGHRRRWMKIPAVLVVAMFTVSFFALIGFVVVPDVRDWMKPVTVISLPVGFAVDEFTLKGRFTAVNEAPSSSQRVRFDLAGQQLDAFVMNADDLVGIAPKLRFEVNGVESLEYSVAGFKSQGESFEIGIHNFMKIQAQPVQGDDDDNPFSDFETL